MSAIPAGNELVRAFLPCRDFELSKRFYEALGFEKVMDGEVAVFNAGSGGFILQRYYVKEWAENCKMQVMVDDLDAWWSRIESLDIQNAFGITWTPRPPAMQPWGLRVAYIADPSGVLWHVAERSALGQVAYWLVRPVILLALRREVSLCKREPYEVRHLRKHRTTYGSRTHSSTACCNASGMTEIAY